MEDWVIPTMVPLLQQYHHIPVVVTVDVKVVSVSMVQCGFLHKKLIMKVVPMRSFILMMVSLGLVLLEAVYLVMAMLLYGMVHSG